MAYTAADMTVDVSSCRVAAPLALLAASLFVPAFAGADEAADRKAEAQRLFAEGQAALEKGDDAAACTLMRKSLSLFAVANSLFNVAQCDEKDGKIAQALEHWKRGLTLIDPTDKRTPVVNKAIETLEAKVPRVSIVVPAKHQPVDILIDDELIAPDRLRAALYIDPGKHTIIVRKPNHDDRKVEILLNERERTEVVAEPGEAIAAPAASSSAPPPPPPPPPPPAGPSPLKIGGFVGLGIGAAGLIGAAITGGIIVGKDGDINAACPNTVCNATGRKLIESQSSLININTALWGVGIAGAAAGAVLLVLDSRSKKENKSPVAVPLVLNRGGGIGLSGRF